MNPYRLVSLHQLPRTANQSGDPAVAESPGDRDDLKRVTESGLVAHLQRVVYYFTFGCITYAISWAPILCRIVRGVVKYPDEMPVAIWVSTVGLLLFYELFIFAQCNSLYHRFLSAFASQRTTSDVGADNTSSSSNTSSGTSSGTSSDTSDDEAHSTMYRAYLDLGSKESRRHNPSATKWCFRVLFAFGFAHWIEIVMLALGATTDLVAAVLLTIPQIREKLGVEVERSRVEPWLVTLYLLVTWTLVGVVLFLVKQCTDHNKALEKLFSSKRNVLVFGSIYIALGAGVFFLWAYVLLANMHSFSYTGTIIATLVVAGCLSASCVYLGITAAAKERDPKLVAFLSQDNAQETQKGDERAGSDEAQVADFARYHTRAFCFHALLVAYTIFIGMATTSDLDWWEDYIGYTMDTYLMTGDWKTVTDARDAAEGNVTLTALLPRVDGDKYRVDYCAAPKSLPVYVVLVAAAWSACSMMQHFVSASRLRRDNRGKVPLSAWFLAVGVVAVATPVLYMCACSRLLVVMTILLLVAPVCLWVVCFGVFSIYPLPAEATGDAASRRRQCLSAINDTRVYRWAEYTVSATLMHLIVLLNTGIIGAHEVFAYTALFAVSMMLANVSDQCMYEAEQQHLEGPQHEWRSPGTTDKGTVAATLARHASRMPISAAINTEKTFIFLSFFAKGILTLALTLPFLFAERATFKIMPAECQAVPGV